MNSENLFAPIAALDLDPIKVKLMHEESGEGWALAYTNAVEFEYRRFLYLVKTFPHEQAAPLADVDVFWHYHILDTMKYAADCEAVFGYFLHHFPYVGLRGADDLVAHHRVGERMRELYEQTYGERYLRRRESPMSTTSGKVVFSVPTGRTAFSVPAAKFAFSVPTAKVALSVPTAALAASGTVVDDGDFDAPTPADAARFYTARPTLARTL